MIIEQIRYFLSEDNRDQVVDARRELARIREKSGLPPGRLLIPDPIPEDGPALVWQCAYPDDDTLAAAETALIGNEPYEGVRARLAALTARVELELYVVDEA